MPQPTCAWARLRQVSNRTGPRPSFGLFVQPKRNRPERDLPMANTPQSEKRARQSDARATVNKARRSRIRTFLRKVEEAIASGDQAAAKAALLVAESELMRGVTKGVLHKNTASRKVSRLASRVKGTGVSA